MEERIGPMPIVAYFHGLEEACRSQGRAVPNVQMWACSSLWGYISSDEGFCAEAASWLGGLWEAPPGRVLLCASSRGRGGSPRIRQHYGLWKTFDLAQRGLLVGEAEEKKVDEGDDFTFVGAAELLDGLTDIAVLALGNAGRASRFLYLARSGSSFDCGRVMPMLPEVFAGHGLPFFAAFDLYPLFEVMPTGDGIVCLQNYGDGLAVYLFEKESNLSSGANMESAAYSRRTLP